MSEAMSGLDASGLTAEDLAVPTRVLNAFERSWPSLWSRLDKGRSRMESLLAVQLQPWCAAPVDFALWVMQGMVQDGQQPKAMITPSLSHEASLAAGLFAWRRRRAIRAVDPALIADGGPLDKTAHLSREAFMHLPGQAVYVVTPGLKLKDVDCIGVLAYLDDRVRKSGRDDPELQLICMLRSGNGAAGAHLTMVPAAIGGTPVGEVTVMPMPMPLPEGDMRAAFADMTVQRFELAKKQLGPDLDRLLSGLGELRTEIASRQDISPEVAREFASMKTDGMGITMEMANSLFDNLEKIARIVALACGDEYSSRIVSGPESGLGEVRLVGPARAETAAEPRTGGGNAASNDPVAKDSPAKPSHATTDWSFGPAVVAVEDLVANAPRLIRPAQLGFLWSQPSGHGVILPRADLSATVAIENARAMMPGLALEIAAPAVFEEKCRAVGDASPGNIDSLVRIPRSPGETWRALIKSPDPDGQYVAAERLLHTLGQYALCHAAGLGPQSLDATRVACYWETAGLIWSLESARKAIGEPRQLSTSIVLQIAAYFAAYPIACFLNLDPRLVTFGLLSEERRSPALHGLIDGYMGDLRYIVAFRDAMAAFLQKRAGVSREEWLDAEPGTRLAMTAQCALQLLRYQDLPARAGLTGPEGGIKWLPEKLIEAMSEQTRGRTIPKELLSMMEIVYDETEKSLLQGLAHGPMPTMLTAFRIDGPAFTTEDYFVPAMTGGSEEDFISRKLANPDCAFVTRISEAWIRRGKEREEGIVLRFLGRDFAASGIYLLTRDPLTLRRQPLVVDGSPEDNRFFDQA